MRQLKVGDKISRINTFNNMVLEIDRVTKTQAITKPYNDAGSVYRFRINVAGSIPKLINASKWDVTDYKLITTEE